MLHVNFHAMKRWHKMVLKDIQLAFGFHSLVQTIYSPVPRVNNVKASQCVLTVFLLLYCNDIKTIKAGAASQYTQAIEYKQ
jgi:hypothetical protein